MTRHAIFDGALNSVRNWWRRKVRDLCKEGVEVRKELRENLHALPKSRSHEKCGGSSKVARRIQKEQDGWRELREEERIWKGLIEEDW